MSMEQFFDKDAFKETLGDILMEEFKGWTITYDYDGHECDHETFVSEILHDIMLELFPKGR